MSIRTERVASMLRREIAGILSSQFNTPGQPMITVTDVQVTNDLSIAKVFVSILSQSPDDADAALGHLVDQTVRIRTSLAARIRNQVKAVPEIRFMLDNTIENVRRLDELFDRIQKTDPNQRTANPDG